MNKTIYIAVNDGYAGVGITVSDAFDELTNNTSSVLEETKFYEAASIEIELVKKETIIKKEGK